MSGPFNFYPFNLPSGGPFLLLYFWVLVGGAAAIVALRALYTRVLIGPQPDYGAGTAPTPSGSTPYRAAPPPKVRHRPLTRGFVPQPDEFWAVAYLRGGSSAVAEVLVSHAIAEGRLRGQTAEGSTTATELSYIGGPPADSTLLLEFYAKLKSGSGASGSWTPAQLRELAREVAETNAFELEQQLIRAGLMADPASATLVKGASLLVVASVAAIAILRILHLSALKRPVLFITLMLLFGCTVLLVQALLPLKSALATAYLSWLGDGTHSLRSDVSSGRRSTPRDVGLAVAIGGFSGVSAAPLLVGFAPVFVISMAAGSSSSCGSGGGSSCGGGGGCGGGCGGGGGCG